MKLGNLPAFLFLSDQLGIRILRHLVLFLFMNALFVMIVLSGDKEESLIATAWLVFVNSLFFFGYAYITAFILFPLLLYRKKYLLFFLLFAFTGIVISLLKFLFSDYVFYEEVIATDIGQRMRSVTWSQVVTNTKDMTFIVAIFLIAKFAKDMHVARSRLEALRSSRLESEISVVSSQLDPHVLFNNLNNLYSLSLNESPEVLPTLRRLKSLLHYYFTDGKLDQIPLEREIQMIRDFIEMEKLRFGERLRVNMRVKLLDKKMHIVPFVLFPFVQNCFEHGIGLDAGDVWLDISIRADAGKIAFKVSNSVPEGIVLSGEQERNILPETRKKQLDLFYPGRYQLIVEESETEYHVSLKLKVNQ